MNKLRAVFAPALFAWTIVERITSGVLDGLTNRVLGEGADDMLLKEEPCGDCWQTPPRRCCQQQAGPNVDGE